MTADTFYGLLRSRFLGRAVVDARLEPSFSGLEDRLLNTLEARYRGFTIDGTLRVDVHEMGDRVELVILVTADENHWAAMFSDPCKRILDAFAGYLRD